MYLLTTHIPIFTDSSDASRKPRTYVTASWHHDLGLARDWLAAPFGGLKVLAPSLPMPTNPSEELAEICDADGLQAIPSYDASASVTGFWGGPRRQWMDDVRRELADVRVLHCSAAFSWQPVWYLALRAAREFDVTKVLIGPDMDPSAKAKPGIKAAIQRSSFEWMIRNGAPTADLLLLKEGLVLERYRHLGRHVEAFCHSVHNEQQVVSKERLDTRLASLPRQPLRAVYAGRLVARKGVADAIDAVAEAKRLGVEIEYHLYGNGPDEAALRERAEARDVASQIVFHGWIEYDAAFLEGLAEFDLLLFMPTEEDTPRMAYDAMAAGLPVVGTRIPFLQHRNNEEHAGRLVEIGDVEGAARELCTLANDPAALRSLSLAARAGGELHTVENWFQRRARWTREAEARRLASKG